MINHHVTAISFVQPRGQPARALHVQTRGNWQLDQRGDPLDIILTVPVLFDVCYYAAESNEQLAVLGQLVLLVDGYTCEARCKASK